MPIIEQSVMTGSVKGGREGTQKFLKNTFQPKGQWRHLLHNVTLNVNKSSCDRCFSCRA